VRQLSAIVVWAAVFCLLLALVLLLN